MLEVFGQAHFWTLCRTLRRFVAHSYFVAISYSGALYASIWAVHNSRKRQIAPTCDVYYFRPLISLSVVEIQPRSAKTWHVYYQASEIRGGIAAIEGFLRRCVLLSSTSQRFGGRQQDRTAKILWLICQYWSTACLFMKMWLPVGRQRIERYKACQ